MKYTADNTGALPAFIMQAEDGKDFATLDALQDVTRLSSNNTAVVVMAKVCKLVALLLS